MNSHEHGFIVQVQKSFIINCQYKLMVSIFKISQFYDTLLLRGQFRTIIISIVIGILLAAKNQTDSRMKR
jgi:hypothetical protein